MRTEWISLLADADATTFAMRRCRGVLYEPDGGSRTVLVASHFSHDFTEHYLAEPLTDAGYAFLAWNNRFVGADEFFRPDVALTDIGIGVTAMRQRFDHVGLLGNSGGGSVMSAYQSETSGPTLLEPLVDVYGALVDGLDRLEPADAYVALNAHESRPKILTEWFDPSVVDERDPYTADPALNLWGERAGSPPYDEAFVADYRAAQAARNQRITDWVRAQLVEVEGHGGMERVFNVYRGWADPRFLDLSLDPSGRKPGCYLSTDVRSANYSAYGLARCCSLRTWLSMWALEVDVLNTARHLPRVTVPALVVQGTADQGVYPSNAEALHANLGSNDKQLVWIEGGDHYFTTDPDHVPRVARIVADWLEDHDFTP